jgi:hypothetical protein
MAVLLSPVGGVAAQFFDNSGNVLTGGKIYTYAAGTTTDQATYTSVTGVTFHTNPIILDASGRVPSGEIWLTDGISYKFVLTDSNDVLIGTYDSIVGINSNFLNFYTQEEIQTATAGQTVFTLSTVSYTPGSNSLSVFVDGVNQYDGSSYAYVETDSTTVTFTAGLHVGALVKFTTAISITGGATNAINVVYDPPFTGGVATTVEHKLSEMISVIDFGATGNGVTDDSASIQAAIDAAQGRPIYIPEGTYILGTPLELNFSSATSPTYQPATQLIGAGQKIVTLVNRSGDYGIKNTPTLAQTAQTIGVRFSGGQLSGFTLTTDGISAAGSGGIELASYWFATLSNLYISSTDTNGISVPLIPAFGANSDKYSCGSLIVDNCELNANAEWGISAEMYSITWTIRNCYIANNNNGAIYTLGVGHQIIDNAIAGNGNAVATTIGGIHLDTAVGFGAPENVLVRDNEFDNNWGSHIYHTGVNCQFIQNRFIQDATAGTGGTTFRNTALVYFDATVATYCSNNVTRNNSVRFDNATNQTILGFSVVNAYRSVNNAFIDNIWSPSAYQSNPAYVTKYNFPNTVNAIKQYAIEEGLQIASSDKVAYQSPQVVVTYVGTTTDHTTPATKIKLQASYNPNILSTFTFSDATNTFTTPYNGLLRIASNLLCKPTVGGVNQAVTISVYLNGASYHAQSIPQGFSSSAVNQNYNFEIVMPVAKGDAITLYAAVASGNLYTVSGTTSTTTFQML